VRARLFPLAEYAITKSQLLDGHRLDAFTAHPAGGRYWHT